MIATCLDMSFSSSWLLSHANTIADTASHYQYNQLFTLAPYLNPQPSTMDPWLVGIKHTLHSQLSVHSFSGMASCLQCATHTALGSASSLTSSSSTLAWPTLMALHYQLPGLQSWNGCPSWASDPCNPLQSNNTSVMSTPSTSTMTLPSTHVKAHRSNGSFEASRGISVNVTGSWNPVLPNSLSPLKSSPHHC